MITSSLPPSPPPPQEIMKRDANAKYLKHLFHSLTILTVLSTVLPAIESGKSLLKILLEFI